MSAAESIPGAVRAFLSSVSDTSEREDAFQHMGKNTTSTSELLGKKKGFLRHPEWV